MKRIIACMVLVGIGLAFPGNSYAQEKKPERLILGFSSVSGNRAPLWIAKDAGLFRKYGLDVNLIFIRSGATTTQALIGGDIQLMAGTGAATIVAAASGAPLVIVASIGPTAYQLIAHPSIKSIDDLKGKIIGTSRPGSNPEFALRRLLPKLGLTPGKDVFLVATGLTESDKRALLVLEHKIDATAVGVDTVVNFALRGQEVSVLADFLAKGIYTSGSDIAVTRQFLKEHPAQLKAFLKSFIEGVWLGRADKQVAYRTFQKYLNARNPKLLESLHRTYFFKTLLPRPYPNLEAIQTDIEDLSAATPALKGRRAADFVDTTILNEIENEGFFNYLQNAYKG